MRMWMVDPQHMCRQHLLGEHLELHMFVGTIKKGVSLEGYVNAGLVETSSIAFRHEQLVQEMEKRGYKHGSPLTYVDLLDQGEVSRALAREELLKRCAACAARAREFASS